MEIIPFGNVNVVLKPCNAHYKWNKITTCVHNLFKGERYVDNYGELVIKESLPGTSNGYSCRIVFEKSSYWSGKKNEVHGTVMNGKGDIIEKIFGKWNESIHAGTSPYTRCIWRPGAMPDNYQLYYGFSRFAMELNELRDEDKEYLPPTDTRFRLDQRLLEEGDIARAEATKLELEQAQRERRKKNEEMGLPDYIPLWFTSNGEDAYNFNDRYWKCRDKHFAGIEFTKLW